MMRPLPRRYRKESAKIQARRGPSVTDLDDGDLQAEVATEADDGISELLSLDDLDGLIRMELAADPLWLEPDIDDEPPPTFKEIAGSWYAVGSADHSDPDDDALLAAHEKLSRIHDQERIVVELHYGFRDAQPMTTREIADYFDMTERRINYLLGRALHSMRES
jgi:DNA-directed RNA polymerase specialized sigma24 family protein